jgi:hypothetical protein
MSTRILQIALLNALQPQKSGGERLQLSLQVPFQSTPKRELRKHMKSLEICTAIEADASRVGKTLHNNIC